MDESLIKIILEKYDIKCDSSLIKIEVMNQYPHIFIMYLQGKKLIVKILDKFKYDNLENIYNCLSDNIYVEKPLKTIDGKYNFIDKNRIIIVYRELQEINTIPSPVWWANCLNSIHNTNVNYDYFSKLNFNLSEETLNLFKNASKYIDYETKRKILYLLNRVSENEPISNRKLVLCHNDPYNSNVMQDNNEYKLIDTDGMGLSLKEFDIQRLFHNNVIASLDIDDSLEFFDKFICNYEKNKNDKIDINLLKRIYIYDLIRAFSWLSIVSNDKNRLDRERQLEQLDLYEKSIIEEKHLKVLKKL
ncbi:MAG: hypothetical protein IJ501_00745 [Bacilli bacterium]|nr:hypothetical protein [Bacilli bacterium]